MSANHVEHFINHNWEGLSALAYSGFIEHGPGALVFRLPRPLAEVTSGDAASGFFSTVSYAPSGCFLADGELASESILAIVNSYDPEREIVMFIIDPEGDSRCLRIERESSPAENFTAYDPADDGYFLPVSTDLLAL